MLHCGYGLGGKYENGALPGTSWKIAFDLEQYGGWKVRNEIVYPCKVADPAPENRLKRGYEKLFAFGQVFELLLRPYYGDVGKHKFCSS